MEVPLLSNFECSFLVLFLVDVSHSCVIKCFIDYYHDRLYFNKSCTVDIIAACYWDYYLALPLT